MADQSEGATVKCVHAAHFVYHRKIIRMCRIIAALHVDAKLFNKLAPKDVRHLKNNLQIRWKMEDKLRELLRNNGDFPLQKDARR